MDPVRFTQLWTRLCGNSPPRELFSALLAAYAEPHRAYHNVVHIDDCLTQFDETKHLAIAPDEVELAIMFHDAVYDSHAGDNEERSAEWARQCLAEANVSDHVREKIVRLILATKHLAAPATSDEALLVDIDLSILGRDDSVFDAYDQAIRQEYAWVPEATYRVERARILKRFLERPTLFRLPMFRDRYEKRARTNLSRALQ